MFWRSMWAAPAYMLWYGFVWYGMVLYGMVWYGMVWNVAVRYDMVFAEAFAAHTFQGQCTEVTFQRYGTVWYGMVQYGMVWYGTVWYGMIWYGMVYCGMVWYGTYTALREANIGCAGGRGLPMNTSWRPVGDDHQR